jgi:hypothetical protein
MRPNGQPPVDPNAELHGFELLLGLVMSLNCGGPP